ncbi:uncharacterized protein [Palaemon carinicauda]|uniref:uncharacterized protein n=1 Tax=Palaemon carinicauda TaxID=392227 RepID=UPI0035B5BCDD
MTLTLNEALSDPAIIQALQEDPDSFRKVRDLKVSPDCILSFNTQINNVVKTAGYHLRNIAFIKKYLDKHSEVDMGLGPFTTILSRFQAVDMSVPFFFDTLGILSARGSAAINPWGFLMPLKNTVWASLIASLLIVCIVHFLFEHFLQPEASWQKQFGRILFEYFQPPLDHALARNTWSVWQKPLLGSWILVSFLLNSSYSGNLKSMMALRYIGHPIQTVRDLIEDTNKKIIIEHRTSYLATVQAIPFGDINELNKVGEAGRYVDYKMRNFLSYSDKILRGDHVQIFDTTNSLYYRAKEFSRTGRCDFYLAKETFIPFVYSMIWQKGSLLTPAINVRIRKVVEAGLYNLWVSQNIDNVTACANPPMKVYLQDPIHLENIWGVAVIWGGGMLLAFSAFALESVWIKYRADGDD